MHHQPLYKPTLSDYVDITMAFKTNKRICLALFLVIIALAFQAKASRKISSFNSISEKHEAWMSQYERVYTNKAEKEYRFSVFKKNMEFIESFNAGKNHKFKLGVNQFADLTNDEYNEVCSGFHPHLMTSVEAKGFMYENVTDVPPSMNWRTRGAVTPVKQQGHCGSCWAFSAIAALEGFNKIKSGALVSLSEQELIDCDTRSENKGCSGGHMSKAFEFIVKKEGLTPEANYMYKGVASTTCKSRNLFFHASTISGFEHVPFNNEAALLKAVARQPVSVAIDSRSYAFQLYSSGVFTGTCGTDLNHGVTVVGYGTEEDGTKYWLVKNSWGPSWGENGYMKIQRDVDDEEGLCGIAMQASYPTA